MKRRPFQQVDVFTAIRYLGNPVAVVFDADDLDEAAMQRFARWTNLSETTFVLSPSNPEADYRLRIFTPGGELPFAGHPTLGSCHAWRQAGGQPKSPDRIVQECGVGLVALRELGSRLYFAAPALRQADVPAETLSGIASALGIESSQIAAAQVLDNGPVWHALLLKDPALIEALAPDHAALKALGTKVGVAAIRAHDEGEDDDEPSGLLISRSNREARAFIAAPAAGPTLEVRAFAAPIGIEEDPVTGSLNASLAQWLIGAGRMPARYEARQGRNLERDGLIEIMTDPDGRLWVGGDAVTCIEGAVQIEA